MSTVDLYPDRPGLSPLVRAIGVCDRCGETTCDNGDWQKLLKSERRALRAAGYNRAARKTLCVRCYAASRHAGETLPPVGSDDTGPCQRCGVTALTLTGLCRDCRDVVADLDETDRWAARA